MSYQKKALGSSKNSSKPIFLLLLKCRHETLKQIAFPACLAKVTFTQRIKEYLGIWNELATCQTLVWRFTPVAEDNILFKDSGKTHLKKGGYLFIVLISVQFSDWCIRWSLFSLIWSLRIYFLQVHYFCLHVFSSAHFPLAVSLWGLNMLPALVPKQEVDGGQLPFKTTMPLKSMKGYLGKPARALR